MKRFAKFFIAPIVAVYFWFFRWLKHHELIRNMKSPGLGAPSPVAMPFIVLYGYVLGVRKLWNDAFISYSLSHYVNFIPKHYSKSGLGYFELEGLSEKDCLTRYKALSDRIGRYFEHNPRTLTYNNGDSFLDVGCGMGQTIKVLVERLPKSTIKGFDVNEGAIRMIKVATKDNPNVVVEIGSATDFSYLSTYADGSFDHVVISHVLTHLLASSLEKTFELRQGVIDELVRICRKSVLVMDKIHHDPLGRINIEIEQYNRCTLVESLAKYFIKHKVDGEVCMMFATENNALYFRKLG